MPPSGLLGEQVNSSLTSSWLANLAASVAVPRKHSQIGSRFGIRSQAWLGPSPPSISVRICDESEPEEKRFRISEEGLPVVEEQLISADIIVEWTQGDD